MRNRPLWLGLAFISPWMVGFVIFTIYPLLSVAYDSLCEYSVLTPGYFVGLRNYADLAVDSAFWLALGNSLFFAAVYLPLSLGAAFLLSILLNVRLPGRGILRTIYFLPTIVPMVCLAVIWQWLLRGDGGLINTLLTPPFHLINKIFGSHLMPPNWLLEPGPARMALVIASLWTLGGTVLIFLAALQDVPEHLYESAEIDGASTFQKYRHITLPSISPVLFYCLVSGLIGCLQTFAIPYVLTGGGDGPNRALLFLSTYIFQNAFLYWNMGYACAVAMVLFGIVLLLTFILVRWSAKRIHTSAD